MVCPVPKSRPPGQMRLESSQSVSTHTWSWPVSAKLRKGCLFFFCNSSTQKVKCFGGQSPQGSAKASFLRKVTLVSCTGQIMQCTSQNHPTIETFFSVHFITEVFLHQYSCAMTEDTSLPNLSPSPHKFNSQVESEVLKFERHDCPIPPIAIN